MPVPVLQSFKPRLTADSIDTRFRYDYGPSVVNGRAFWCCGLGTDTIVNATWTGQHADPVFGAGDHLIADPAAMATSTGFLVAHTIGMADGTRNGINWYSTNANGQILRVGVIIPQATRPGTYGIGQPGLVALPDNAYLMVFRRDGTHGENFMGAAVVDSRSLKVRRELQFAHDEDGASPEPFWYRDRLHILLVAGDERGRGWAGIRRYTLAGDTIVRETATEVPYAGSGGPFWAQPGAVALTNVKDGAGVARDAHNNPIVVNNRITVWRGWRDSLTESADWKIVRLTLELPR